MLNNTSSIDNAKSKIKGMRYNAGPAATKILDNMDGQIAESGYVKGTYAVKFDAINSSMVCKVVPNARGSETRTMTLNDVPSWFYSRYNHMDVD